MNPLKKIAGKFFGNKGKKKAVDPVSKILTLKAKIMAYGIGAGIAFLMIIIVVILAVVSYFLGFVQEMVEDVSRMVQAGCIFCSDADLEKLKEEQFKSKIMIIEDTFGEQVDGVVLASTVLFQGDYYEVIDSQYDTNYNEETYRDFWSQMKEGIRSLTYNEDDGYAGITTEEINLIDAATIVMVESNVDGKYNEDSYKHALTVNGFIEDPVRNSWICFTESTRGLLETIWDANPFVAAYNLLVNGTSDTIADNALQMANTVDICNNGFIGGTYANIASIQDEDQKQREKEKIAQNIIDFAKFYKELFPEDDECLYAGDVGTGDITNWRQCGAAWSNKSLGGVRSVCEIGCTATSMSYLIAKSGTQLTVSSFDPGVFVDNASFTGGALYWDSWNEIAPNFTTINRDVPVNNSNAADVLSSAISQPCNGDKQPFIVLYLSKGHWVAFDHVENGTVYVMDPSAKAGVGLVPLNEAWKGDSLYSYNKFCANDVNFGSTGSSSSSGSAGANSSVTKYLKAMKAIADDNSHGYSMSNRTGPDYDCSSFIYYALVNAGVLSSDGYPFSTGNMGDVLIQAGFKQLPYDKNNLQMGDILVDSRSGASGHTTTIYSTKDGKIQEIAAHYDTDGKTGDSSGNEINVGEFKEGSHKYQYIYRLNGASGDDLCEPTGLGSMDELAGLLAYLEGAGTCNYKGQGDGTGYTSYDLHDGAGMTSAFGITMGTGAPYASEIGYSSYATDMENGCTDKGYMEQIFAQVLESYVDQTRALVEHAGLSLSESQILALTSITYNTGPGGGIVNVIDSIKNNGADNVAVWSCMVSRHCSYTTGYNLAPRRAAEYEAFISGNFNAAKPNESYDALTSINTSALLEEYKKTHWPSSR